VSDGKHFCKNNVTVKDASQVTTKFTFDKAVDGSTVTSCIYFQGSRYCDTQDYFGESFINVISIAEGTP
jgi:hypothetical protein